jgi:putative membrane protein
MRLMTRNRLLTAIGCMLLAIPGLAGCNRDRGVEAAQEGAQENRPPSVTPTEQDFMRKTAETGLSDIDMARLALQKSGNSDVRDFANMIQSDTTAALEDLSDLMKNKGVSQPKIASADARQDTDRMAGLMGPEFDREFINMMVADRQKAVERFRDQIGIAMDADVKQYAEDRLPKLEMHLEKAQRLQSRLFRAVGSVGAPYERPCFMESTNTGGHRPPLQNSRRVSSFPTWLSATPSRNNPGDSPCHETRF